MAPPADKTSIARFFSADRFPPLAGGGGTLLHALCLLLLFLGTFFVSGAGPVTGLLDRWSPLDVSWQLVLEYAAKHRLQFGKDVVFTYGPLGYLFTGVGQGYLLAARVVFAFARSLFTAWATVGIARRFPGLPGRLFFLWALLFGTFSGGLDQFTFLVILYCGFLLLDGSAGRASRGSFLVFIAVVSLAKFTYLIAALAVVLVTAGCRLAGRNYRRAFSIVLGYLTVLALLWLATGQHPENLASWVKGSLEISGGYSKAMSRPAAPAILCLCLLSAALFLRRAAVEARGRLGSLPDAAFLALILLFDYLAWKQGFVRADDHPHTFALFQPAAFLLLYLHPSTGRAGSVNAAMHKQLAAVLVFCAAAMVIRTDGAILTEIFYKPVDVCRRLKTVCLVLSGNLDADYPALHPDKSQLKELDLPIARALIGNSTVDVLDFQQWTALVNGLNYHPRPVIQGYSAYTPYLQSMNRVFYEGVGRPEFVIFRLETIDNRFPTLDDAPLLIFLLQNYRIVAREKGFLIMRHSGTGKPPQLRQVHEERVPFGQRVDLSRFNDKIFVMQAVTRPTLWGRVVNTLYHAPILSMRVLAGGKEPEARIVPEMASTGFLFNPLLFDNGDVSDFYLKKGTAAEAVTFLRPTSAFGTSSDTVEVRILRIEE